GDDETGSRHRHRAASPTLLVAAVASGLRQFDIHLDDIDIVSVKVRRGGPDARSAELSKLDDFGPEEWDVVGDEPTSYIRRTWLVLRMNPQRNVAAVAARDSLASTLVAATERLAQDLDGLTCAARPLTAEEIAEVDRAVLADLEPTWSRPGWRRLKHFNGFVTSLWLSPSDITTDKLEELWDDDTFATVLTIRLTARAG
ncbi:type VII secretion protein EccE, partial [Mycobacterium avium]